MKPIVKLMTDPSNALNSMTFAARLCYGHENEERTYVQDVLLMESILRAGHLSILEHASLSFYITGVSRNFTHQLVRHRVASFAQQSLHFTIAKDCSLPTVAKATHTQQRIMDLTAKKAFAAYNKLLASGMKREDARHVLPSGIATKIVMTANLREWVYFVGLRSCGVNCDEIREVACAVLSCIEYHMTWLAPWLGPRCITGGGCRERKSCGKFIMTEDRWSH